MALWEEDDITVGTLGEKLFLESNTLTPLLKKLETLGYISRRRDPADERQVRILLTDAGRQLREKGGQTSLVKDYIESKQLVAPIPKRLKTGFRYHLVYPLGADQRPEIALFRDWIVGEAHRE